MKKYCRTALVVCLATTSMAIIADEGRDCLLKGTVQGNEGNAESVAKVRFHSMGKYDENAKCRVRRNEKMQFKLPDDPRLKEAPPGSTVKFRYREDEQGGSTTELLSVGA
jgi:hypothetical protein